MAASGPGYDYVSPKKDGLRIGHININSLLNKLDVVKDVILYYDFDILSISETHLDPTIEDYEIELPGYRTKYLREDKALNRGGLLVYVRDSYTVRWKQQPVTKTVDRGSKKGYFQYIEIEIAHPIAMHLVAIYRHKDFSKFDLYDNITNFIQNSKTKNKEIILLGDFNLNYSDKDDSAALRLIESHHGLTQLVKHSTYHKKESATLIDHIYTNLPEETILESGIIRLAISDHDLIYCTLTVDEPLQRRTQDIPADIARMRDETVLQRHSVSHLMSAIHTDGFLGKNVKFKPDIMPACLKKLGEAKCDFLVSLSSSFVCQCTKACESCEGDNECCSCKSKKCEKCSCHCKCEKCKCDCRCIECSWRTCRKVREAETKEYDRCLPLELPISFEEVKSAVAKIGHPLLPNGDEEAKSKIEEHLCDMFNALLSSGESEETDVVKFVCDTFESVMMRRQKGNVVKALEKKVEESLGKDCFLYACLYKFSQQFLNEGLVEDMEVSDFPRKKLNTYVAQRKSNNAKPANLQSSMLRQLSEKINGQADSESESLGQASDHHVRSFHCSNEIIIVQMVKKTVAPKKLCEILKAKKEVLQDAKYKELIIFREEGANYKENNGKLLGLGPPKSEICFLGATISDQHLKS